MTIFDVCIAIGAAYGAGVVTVRSNGVFGSNCIEAGGRVVYVDAATGQDGNLHLRSYDAGRGPLWRNATTTAQAVEFVGVALGLVARQPGKSRE